MRRGREAELEGDVDEPSLRLGEQPFRGLDALGGAEETGRLPGRPLEGPDEMALAHVGLACQFGDGRVVCRMAADRLDDAAETGGNRLGRRAVGQVGEREKDLQDKRAQAKGAFGTSRNVAEDILDGQEEVFESVGRREDGLPDGLEPSEQRAPFARNESEKAAIPPLDFQEQPEVLLSLPNGRQVMVDARLREADVSGKDVEGASLDFEAGVSGAAKMNLDCVAVDVVGEGLMVLAVLERADAEDFGKSVVVKRCEFAFPVAYDLVERGLRIGWRPGVGPELFLPSCSHARIISHPVRMAATVLSKNFFGGI